MSLYLTTISVRLLVTFPCSNNSVTRVLSSVRLKFPRYGSLASHVVPGELVLLYSPYALT